MDPYILLFHNFYFFVKWISRMRRIYFNLVKLEKEIYFIEILWILITFPKVGPGLLSRKEKKYGNTTVINLLRKILHIKMNDANETNFLDFHPCYMHHIIIISCFSTFHKEIQLFHQGRVLLENINACWLYMHILQKVHQTTI